MLGFPGEETEVDDDGGGGMILQIAIEVCSQVPKVLVGECCRRWRIFGKGWWETVSRW